VKNVKEALGAQGVHTLIAQFTDIHGVAKGKWVPLAHLDELLTEGVGFSGPSIAGTGLPRMGSRSEYYGRGLASTARAKLMSCFWPTDSRLPPSPTSAS